jgi:hypothetical protein
MTPPDPFSAAGAALMPAAALNALAPFRDRADIRVHPAGEATWVAWPAGRSEVARRLHPVPGVEFYEDRDGRWFRLGRLVPSAAGPPAGEGARLVGLLTPDRIYPLPPGGVGPRARIRLVRGGDPRPAAALACETTALSHWADTATTAELAAVRAARCGKRVVLLGKSLPGLAGAVRYWGNEVLVPVGFRADPDLPTAGLHAAVGAAAGEIVVFNEQAVDLIPAAAFEPLTRAGIRLALRDLAPVAP